MKSVADLADIFCNTVGHNSVLFLNFQPDRRGLIHNTDSRNAAGLPERIEGTFKNNLASGASITALYQRGADYSPSNLVDNPEGTYYATSDGFNTDIVTLDLGTAKTFDCLML